jgi:TPP-dependent 2-oxoacid decarboxylase
LLTIGLRRLDSTSAFFSDSIPASAIHLNATSVNIGLDNYQAVGLSELLEELIDGASRKNEPRTQGGR